MLNIHGGLSPRCNIDCPFIARVLVERRLTPVMDFVEDEVFGFCKYMSYKFEKQLEKTHDL